MKTWLLGGAAVLGFIGFMAATASWVGKGKRVLVKEVKEEIFVEEINAL